MSCRKLEMMSKHGRLAWLMEKKMQRVPWYCLCDIRRKEGVTLSWALQRNTRTCRPDDKRESQAGNPCKRKSSEAGHRGGIIRSSVEGGVMLLERRDDLVKLD
jgi:hypothetical protein